MWFKICVDAQNHVFVSKILFALLQGGLSKKSEVYGRLWKRKHCDAFLVVVLFLFGFLFFVYFPFVA